MSRSILMAVFFLTAGFLRAQEGAVEPVLQPAEWMHWKISIDRADQVAREGDAKRLVSRAVEAKMLEYIRTENLMKVMVTMSSGLVREFWRQGDGVLVKNVHTGRIRMHENSARSEPYPYAASPFHGISSVKMNDDHGVVAYQGRKCRYFRGERARTFVNESGSDESAKAAYEAWFDAATGLPVAYRERGRVFLYQFFPRPTALLVMPPEWKEAIERDIRNRKKMGLLPVGH